MHAEKVTKATSTKGAGPRSSGGLAKQTASALLQLKVTGSRVLPVSSGVKLEEHELGHKISVGGIRQGDEQCGCTSMMQACKFATEASEAVGNGTSDRGEHGDYQLEPLCCPALSFSPMSAQQSQHDLLRLQAAQKQQLKGKHWFMESCLRDGTCVKLDKSGRTMLTLLRHLGRLQEVWNISPPFCLLGGSEGPATPLSLLRFHCSPSFECGPHGAALPCGPQVRFMNGGSMQTIYIILP